MADNFNITEGSGKTIRAIEKSSKEAQVVVLDIGGAGGESLLTGTLPVSLASVPSHAVTNSGVFAVQDDGPQIGSLTETAPANDTASSGLNGRLQRIAQNITSLIAKLPVALGSGGGLKIDGSGTALPISVASLPSVAVTNVGTFATQSTLQAGTNYVGTTGGNTAQIDVTPTLTVAATYVSGDYVGTSTTPMTFLGASRINNSTATILSAVLVDGALQSVACELWLFDTTLTAPADSAAWTLTDAEAKRCIGVIPFSTYYASGANSISFAQGVGIGFKTISASTSLYGCLVTRGSPTYASGDLTVRLNILQD